MGLRRRAKVFPETSSDFLLAHQIQLREQRRVRTSFLIILISQDRLSRLSKGFSDCHYRIRIDFADCDLILKQFVSAEFQPIHTDTGAAFSFNVTEVEHVKQ